jgi:prephenate dehydrogenase
MRERARSVLVVGAGMIGTSVAMALSERGHHVYLRDVDDDNLATAQHITRAPRHNGEHVDLAVAAVPPRHTGPVLAELLCEEVAAAVTDCASIKSQPVQVTRALLARRPSDGHATAMSRYVGGHPLAGRERRGPRAARVDLFAGRPWVLTPHEESSDEAIGAAQWLVAECRASTVIMTASEHDRAVAMTSHLAQIAASALAAQLENQDDHVLALAGQGLRDMTRIAGSDPELWADIVAGNAGAVGDVLQRFSARLEDVIAALRRSPDDAADAVRAVMRSGRAGRQRMPGKHGESPRTYRAVPVVVPDERGQMARLLADAADAGVNIEDLRVDHAPGLPMGLIELYVASDSEETLSRALAARGWTLTSPGADDT